MPRYDYKCPECPQTEEVTHSIYEAPVVTCPKCITTMKRVISPVPTHFKGEGWT